MRTAVGEGEPEPSGTASLTHTPHFDWKECVALAEFHLLPQQKNKLVGSRMYVN